MRRCSAGGVFQLGLFGIILSIAGAFGCVIGGFIDDRIGAKSVILWSLILLFIGSLGVLSIDRNEVLFLFPLQAGHGPAFSSIGEQLYIAFAILIGLASGPLQASSRSLLARMAPGEQMTEFFGLFAFSGRVTAFAAPLSVALLTQWSGSQRIGISALLLFLFAGFVLMAAVKPQYRD